MITVLLDGEEQHLPKGSLLSQLIPDHPPECSVAVVRPGEETTETTSSIRLFTSRGELVVELEPEGTRLFLDNLTGITPLLKWQDRQSAAFGNFPATYTPVRKTTRYEKNDLILGCQGYAPTKSCLVFSRARHIADYGAADGGGVIGKVVSGRGIPALWTQNDTIDSFERIIARADVSNSFTTTNWSLPLEDGMEIITRLKATAEGFGKENIDTRTAESVEHMLIALSSGRYTVALASSTHIRDDVMSGTDVLPEKKETRLEGTMTARVKGRNRGSIYIYTTDLAGTPSHTIVGRISHGIEIAKLAKKDEDYIIEITPQQFDLLGLSLSEGKERAKERGVNLNIDTDEAERIIVNQHPATTLEVLAAGEAEITTVPSIEVIDITLDDVHAPDSCAIFREITGLKWHATGVLPLYFTYEDVYLFNPTVSTKTKVHLENTPSEMVPANALGMTNDSRKGTGMIGVRINEHTEFGPTAEPFDATNILGTVLQPEKLTGIKDGSPVFIREVKL